MKKVWNKETRNEDDLFYRNRNWGIEVPNDFFKPNFTEQAPPKESLENSCPCDWNDELEGWVLDMVAADHIEGEKGLKETDIPTVRIVEDLISLLISKEIITEDELPTGAQTKLNKRKVWREKL